METRQLVLVLQVTMRTVQYMTSRVSKSYSQEMLHVPGNMYQVKTSTVSVSVSHLQDPHYQKSADSTSHCTPRSSPVTPRA